MLDTALDCSVELLSYFCCYWCLLKISHADVFSLPPLALDAWMLIYWMRSGASGEWEVGLLSFADLGWADGQIWCIGYMLVASSWCSADPGASLPACLPIRCCNWLLHKLLVSGTGTGHEAQFTAAVSLGIAVVNADVDLEMTGHVMWAAVSSSRRNSPKFPLLFLELMTKMLEFCFEAGCRWMWKLVAVGFLLADAALPDG
ncbi:hypothetical protein Nepgr_017411 [Nepenthes gracilis]|uniref:Uncharacterized protein n=1 Tax=Nepenthes gracilis TaxID=150966 RepID=A0AAD3XTC6_NEPGR|nr:hypothetical protein Nepgr_017411 [Nepenthes gracilis]